jgi:heavy metal translocating P-type ATPase
MNSTPPVPARLIASAPAPLVHASPITRRPVTESEIPWQRLFSSTIAAIAALAIAIHLLLRFVISVQPHTANVPLLAALILGGTPLVLILLGKLIHRQFGSDLLAGISIVTSVILGEYLAGTLVVLMLSGGEALEAYAVRKASSVLEALAKRMPSTAHRTEGAKIADVPLMSVAVGDTLLVMPHEICPVDGMVVEGHGVMDESYLTGEPFRIPKAPGSDVISGALNGDALITIRAGKIASDSRYAKIMQVMRASEKDSPKLRRLGDRLGAFYTPIAVAVALAAWGTSGQAARFLAVLVVATPCPLLIAIPVAIIGSISLAARTGIVIRKPVVLEQLDRCRTVIFDKTGTLTYGAPALAEVICAPGVSRDEVLGATASLERYSKHPLGGAVIRAAEKAGLATQQAGMVSEKPGDGLRGTVSNRSIRVTGRNKLAMTDPALARELSASADGMECVVLIDDKYAATLRFRDEVRAEGRSFVGHLAPRHHFKKLVLLSGDRESEVSYLAQQVGIKEIYAGKSPEEKLASVRTEMARAPTLYVGDGINDAPSLAAATVGVALGRNSDITAEAAGAVILDSSLTKVDVFLHIARRMRQIALQSAIGGMSLSVIGMAAASIGYLPPVAGAVCQEIIDVLAVLNALRAAFPPKSLTDF